MRRFWIIAACFALLALVPASAQRGGHGGFAGHGGGHSFAGFSSGSHSFSGMRASPRAGFRFSGGFGDRGFHHGGFRRCWGCRVRYRYPWYAGYGYGYEPYYPFWWSDNYDSYDYDQERDRDIAAQENALNLQEQNLRDREQWLRGREQDAYREQSRNEAPAKPEPATVLVFRDQHQQEITNYAISSGTLWVLSDHAVAKKIPIADLDLDATAKANDDRGVEFQVPR